MLYLAVPFVLYVTLRGRLAMYVALAFSPAMSAIQSGGGASRGGGATGAF